jgi:hypothetical protein
VSSDPESETGGDPPTPDPERFPTADRTEIGGTTMDRSTSDPGDEEFGFRGWVLIGVVLVSFFVIPAVGR